RELLLISVPLTVAPPELNWVGTGRPYENGGASSSAGTEAAGGAAVGCVEPTWIFHPSLSCRSRFPPEVKSATVKWYSPGDLGAGPVAVQVPGEAIESVYACGGGALGSPDPRYTSTERTLPRVRT